MFFLEFIYNDKLPFTKKEQYLVWLCVIEHKENEVKLTNILKGLKLYNNSENLTQLFWDLCDLYEEFESEPSIYD
jgi:hypothetical protein